MGVERCRAICAVTSDDLINLTAALNARRSAPDLRVVLRLFDPELALRAQHGLSIRFTRSVSHLAAPAFAAAAIGSQVEASIPVGDKRVLLFARIRAALGSPLARLPISTLAEPGDVTVLGVQAEGAPAEWAADGARLAAAERTSSSSRAARASPTSSSCRGTTGRTDRPRAAARASRRGAASPVCARRGRSPAARTGGARRRWGRDIELERVEAAVACPVLGRLA